MKLTPGHVYKARGGHLRLCYRCDDFQPPPVAARCVRLSDYRVERYYADGRYTDEPGPYDLLEQVAECRQDSANHARAVALATVLDALMLRSGLLSQVAESVVDALVAPDVRWAIARLARDS